MNKWIEIGLTVLGILVGWIVCGLVCRVIFELFMAGWNIVG